MIPFRSARALSDLRSVATILAVLALVSGCAGPAASATPTDGRSPAASTATQVPPTAVPSASQVVTPSVNPRGVAARWEAAGTMQVARPNPRVVRLGDGRVLVLGDYSTYRQEYDSTIVELWDPATGGWRTTAPLNKARGEYVAVPLRDGRALVAGGINERGESYSSTYLFDPRTERWEKAGLLRTARAGAAGALLRDGRVLVAGGSYYSGFLFGTGGAILAGYGLADVEPGRAGYALATAELFDAATGTWSPTGSMRYAMAGASAVTLGDGRVLVWGVSGQEGPQVGEIYDPATGRFSPAPPLPDVDRSSLETRGIPIPGGSPKAWSGSEWVMPLADGDALLVGSGSYWPPLALFRTFRFHAATDTWTEVGESFVSSEVPEGAPPKEWGVRLPAHSSVAALADGSVLFAGGWDAERAAGLLDAATGAWSSLSPMPAGRDGGASVTLADGSVLIVGGSRASRNPSVDRPGFVADALRFIPGD